MSSIFAQTKKFQAGLEGFNTLDLELLKEVLERLMRDESLLTEKKLEDGTSTSLVSEAISVGTNSLFI